jgi:cell division protease FtsH
MMQDRRRASDDKEEPVNPFYKNLALWLVILLIMVLLFNVFNTRPATSGRINFSDFLSHVERGEVTDIEIQDNTVAGSLKDGKTFRAFIPPNDPDLVKTLRANNVRITVKPAEQSPLYLQALISWAPMLLLIGVWIFFMRQMQAGGGKAMSFGKSKAKLHSDQSKKVTFEDVAGIDEAKDEVQELIAFLKDPKKFTKLGGRIPKGVLLVGSPGSGKTLLARAIAGEAGVPFFSISGSEFVEMFVGVGASRVRDLFTQGKKNAPCIIFIDEIDAVGRHRGAGLGGGHDEREQTLNQLLVEMDGFESNDGVILVAATNRPDVLDPALLRPGRFDRQVVVPRPDVKGRLGILKVHVKRTPLASDVDLQVVARGTPGFSGADLANLVNEAALLAARLGKSKLDMQDFEMAKDKVLMGTERRSIVISDEEKRITAYHEGGHTIVAAVIPGTDPLHKVTIIPRGQSLGLTQQLPIDEKHTYPKDYLLNNIAILMGGRAAEEIVLQRATTGAANDIERATEFARKMVCEWGMSEKLGPLTYGKKEEQIFLGREFAQHRDYSESTAVEIDQEVKRIVSEAHERAKTLIRQNLDALHRLAAALLDKETLDGREILRIIRGEEEPAPTPEQPPAGTRPTGVPTPEPKRPPLLPGLGGLPDPNPA